MNNDWGVYGGSGLWLKASMGVWWNWISRPKKVNSKAIIELFKNYNVGFRGGGIYVCICIYMCVGLSTTCVNILLFFKIIIISESESEIWSELLREGISYMLLWRFNWFAEIVLCFVGEQLWGLKEKNDPKETMPRAKKRLKGNDIPNI